MKRRFALILLLILIVLIIAFMLLPIKGERIFAKVPIDNAKQITIQKTSEHETEVLNVASCTVSDEAVQDFIEYFKDTTLQNLYGHSFPIESDIRYFVSVETSDDMVQINMKFYHDDAVLIDCVYGDRPAFHGRYKIGQTDLIALFEAMLDQNN